MISFVIVGHDQFPEGMGNTAQFITGSKSGVEICSLGSDEGLGSYKEKLLSIITNIQDIDKTIILCDLVGGTPFKAAMEVSLEIDKQVRIVTGINLPGLLTGIMLKDSLEINKLVEEITRETRDGVKSF